MSEEKTIRCFMDGLDWQHHLEADKDGTKLFPSVDATRLGNVCIQNGGGCGIVEVEVRLIRWAEEQKLDYERPPTKTKRDE